LPLKPGDPARTAPVLDTETALLAALGDGGHPFAKVANRRVEIDNDTQTMEVTYTFDPGPVMRFGPVAIEGLERLDPAYVEGRLRWQRGEVYDASKVEETRRALIETGLFSTVKITSVADPDNPAPLVTSGIAPPGRKGECGPARQRQFNPCRPAGSHAIGNRLGLSVTTLGVLLRKHLIAEVCSDAQTKGFIGPGSNNLVQPEQSVILDARQ
jgi:Surface antigen variable number repeat